MINTHKDSTVHVLICYCIKKPRYIYKVLDADLKNVQKTSIYV